MDIKYVNDMGQGSVWKQRDNSGKVGVVGAMSTEGPET